MNIVNKLSDYSPTERAALEEKLKEFFATIKELDTIIENEIDTPTVGEDNVLHLDMSVFTEYRKQENASLPLAEVLEIYDRWIEKLNYLVKVNVGQYVKNPNLMHFIIQLRAVCVSFINLKAPQDAG